MLPLQAAILTVITIEASPNLPARPSYLASQVARLLVAIISVVRVHPRASKGITDLLLSCLFWLDASYQDRRRCLSRHCLARLSKLNNPSGSRSLPQSRRQITSRTKNGHAPLSTVSGKLGKLTIHSVSCPGKVSRVGSN